MSEPFTATSSISDVRRLVAAARGRGLRIGCVPTMGALHSGHVSLFEECRRHAEFVVATIFVNPMQFAPHEDLQKYPRPLVDDLAAARSAEVDLVYNPSVETMYPPGFSTAVTVGGVSSGTEGAIRPDHFRGVATVVLKLFNIVQPDVAIFGAKDYQQQAVLRRMTCDLDLPIEIVTAPTIREPDGLAKSSRNVYLSSKERKSALVLSESLRAAEERLKAGEKDLAAVTGSMLDLMKAAPGVVPDYAIIADPESLQPLTVPQSRMVILVAARVGLTRLIDNREVTIGA